MAKTKEVRDPIDSVLENIDKSMGIKKKEGERTTFSRFKNISFGNCQTISFGLPEIDKASYCGGIPRGKLVEIFGPESSGKSLMTLYLIGVAQKMGLECVLIDIEQSFDPSWATQHGVNVDNLLYSNEFECGEQALEYAYKFCACGKIGLVVIDSTAALLPKSEIEGSLDENARMGAHAQIMSRGCRKIIDACGKTDTTCIFINQVRDKIGGYGNPETTPGGKALRFYSHQRIRVQQIERIKAKEGSEDIVVGQVSSVTFVKNKVARPFGKCVFKIIFDKNALNPVVALCNLARELKIVKIYKGVLKISKEITGTSIDTGAITNVELANYIINNKLVDTIIDGVVEANDEQKLVPEIDESILELKGNPDKIVKPDAGGKVEMDVKKVEDAKVSEVESDIAGEDTPPDEEKE